MGHLIYLAAQEHSTQLARRAAAARAVRAQGDPQRARHWPFRL